MRRPMCTPLFAVYGAILRRPAFAANRVIGLQHCRPHSETNFTENPTTRRAMATVSSRGESVVAIEEMRSYMMRCMTKVGTPDDHARCLASALVAADYRGHYSHGLNRLDMYVDDVVAKITAIDCEPTIDKETAATALVNGRNCLGPVVGTFCQHLAIRKAEEAGIGWVVCHGSNHYSVAAYYATMALERGFLGMSFTNTSPIQVPTRARAAVLGTNPLCLVAPAENGDSFQLDMATSTVALGKLEMCQRKGESIPAGWGTDIAGKVSTDPTPVLNGGGLMPLGGAENTGGYKGYGLAMLVEVFCGILGGSAYGPGIRSWKTHDREANLGQCFVAIDPGAFAPGFQGRMSDLMTSCRQLEPAEGETDVLVAGDPEREHMALCDRLGGIPYHENQIVYARNLAKKLAVDPMPVLNV